MSGAPREYLLDISRLIWRAWQDRLPTGIDRVCLEYIAHFGPRSLAVIQRSGSNLILSHEHSDRLFKLILQAPSDRRWAFVALGPLAWATARRRAPRPGMIYLSVGHTGLDSPVLSAWIAKNQVRAFFLVHDVIPLTHPHFCRAGEAEKHARRMRNVLASAAGIIGNSQATLDELAAFAASSNLPMPPCTAAWISGLQLPLLPPPRALDRPYFVTLGTIEGRKNHVLLFQIWRRLTGKLGVGTPQLVVIGQRGWEAGAAFAMLDRDPLLRTSVTELNCCSDEEVVGWMRGARALLMPSFAEGFGLPIIEALQLSTPVIASDLAVYHEIVGDLPTYQDPLDGPGWERAILGFLGAYPERERQLAAVADYKAPTWGDHFAQVEDWIASVGKLQPNTRYGGTVEGCNSDHGQ